MLRHAAVPKACCLYSIYINEWIFSSDFSPYHSIPHKKRKSPDEATHWNTFLEHSWHGQHLDLDQSI